MRARALIGPDDPVLRRPADEALTEVYALSGQVDRAIEMGRTLLARLGRRVYPARAGQLHLGIARAAIAGARWAEAAASIAIARGSRWGRGTPRWMRARRRSRSAGETWPRRMSWRGLRWPRPRAAGCPEVACEALEVIGRVARQRDLDTAERAFAQAERGGRARTGCGCGGCGRCTSWARSTSCAPRARTGWSRPGSWRWRRARWR